MLGTVESLLGSIWFAFLFGVGGFFLGYLAGKFNLIRKWFKKKGF